jgi:hypothetical protein
MEGQFDAFFSRDCEQLFALRSAIPTKYQALLPSLEIVQTPFSRRLHSTLMFKKTVGIFINI